jgi:hypothetical protein
VTVLGADPETGEIRDPRDIHAVVRALVTGSHTGVRERVVLGKVRLRSGMISVADPRDHLHKQPLVRSAPIGEHSVTALYGSDPTTAVALVIHFADGEVTDVERAPSCAGPSRTSVRSPCARAPAQSSISDPIARLTPPKLEELSEAIASAIADAPAALVSLPRVRTWNVVACRVPGPTHGFYSTHWALGRQGPLALVVDFATFG